MAKKNQNNSGSGSKGGSSKPKVTNLGYKGRQGAESTRGSGSPTRPTKKGNS